MCVCVYIILNSTTNFFVSFTTTTTNNNNNIFHLLKLNYIEILVVFVVVKIKVTSTV